MTPTQTIREALEKIRTMCGEAMLDAHDGGVSTPYPLIRMQATNAMTLLADLERREEPVADEISNLLTGIIAAYDSHDITVRHCEPYPGIPYDESCDCLSREIDKARKLIARPPATRLSEEVCGLSVDELAQQIRIVDGSNNLGAAALAEALMPFIEQHR